MAFQMPKKKGICESCDRQNEQLYQMYGNMFMCKSCVDAEPKPPENPVQFVVDSRKKDTLVTVEQDIFNTETTSIIALQSAIQHDETIADDKKSYALVQECATRIEQFDAAIFKAEKALLDAKNQRHAWIVAAQTETANIRQAGRMEQLEYCKKYDINYKPTPVVKPKKVTTPSSGTTSKGNRGRVSIDVDALKAACSKYGVPMSTIQMMLEKRLYSTADEAASALSAGRKSVTAAK